MWQMKPAILLEVPPQLGVHHLVYWDMEVFWKGKTKQNKNPQPTKGASENPSLTWGICPKREKEELDADIW